MSRPPKARVRQSFERAAPSYDAAAIVQRRICQHLAAALPASPAPARILDAGSGTGYARSLLHGHWPDAEIVALDLSTAMLRRVAGDCRRLAGDLEQLPLATASIDLYWSSLALQWCDFATALAEARRAIRPRGRLALATLAPQTFHELRHAFAGIDAHRHTLAFQPPEEIRRDALAAGWFTVDLEICSETLHYPDLRSLLQAVKAVGANQLGDGRRSGLMSRAALAHVEAAYETLRTPAGLPLTYQIIYLHAQPCPTP